MDYPSSSSLRLPRASYEISVQIDQTPAFELSLGQVTTTYETGNQTLFPEPRFDVAIGTVTKQVGTVTKRIGTVKIYLDYLGTVRKWVEPW